MHKFYVLGLIALAAVIIGLAWAEQMTFSTYYPAPAGVYNQMVTRCLGVGDQDGDGLNYADAPDPNIAAQENDLWIAGQVGIGTTNPQSDLQVAGGVQIGNDTSNCNPAKAGTMRYNAGAMEYCDGADWVSMGGVGAFTPGTEGSITFPSGLIMKWGADDLPGNAQATLNKSFATPFPNACFTVIGGAYVGGDNATCQINSYNKNGFQAYTHNWWAAEITWVAMGN